MSPDRPSPFSSKRDFIEFALVSAVLGASWLLIIQMAIRAAVDH